MRSLLSEFLNKICTFLIYVPYRLIKLYVKVLNDFVAFPLQSRQHSQISSKYDIPVVRSTSSAHRETGVKLIALYCTVLWPGFGFVLSQAIR